MATSRLRNAIATFVDKLNSHVDTHTLEDILEGSYIPDGRDVGGTEPEAWMEDNIIYDPIIDDVLQHRKRRFPYSDERIPDRPDFELIEYGIIGENKIVNDYDTAVDEIKDYLKNKGFDEEFGIATDGLKWGLFRIDTGGDFLEYDDVAEVDLRPVAREYAVEQGYIGQAPLGDADTDERLDAFIENFGADGLEYHIDTAPQQFRDDRQGTIDQFYDLYVELLFGEGSGGRTYDTTLLEDINAPENATETDERVFAVTLVNRLLFIKMLEDRDVLSEGFLRQRVQDWRESNDRLAGDINLYDDQIKPLFYELFNQPRPRNPPYNDPDKWFDEVDYLNGGLFRENVDNEKEYSVENRILPDIINDLIEGHELGEQNGLDPAVLGSVFEMTINHISGEEGRQKDIGAYYTPNDATNLVTTRTVDAAIRDALIDVYSDYYPEIRDREGDFPLDKMLRWIEDGTQWFGDPEATEEAYERLGELQILDPACGSGHFLTAALNELNQARLSVMRGMGWDEEDDWDTRVYEAKEELALNAIYGVDVDPVAVEIAKLRVWLKIIEEGWDEEYGKLPNIDLNVVAGNSLVGLPVRTHGQVTLNLFQGSVDRIEELRQEYKQENEDVRGEITERLEELNQQLNDEYLDRLDHTHDFNYLDITSFDDLSNRPIYIQEDNFVDKVVSVTLRKPSVDELSEDERDWLDANGFSSNPAWGTTARIEVTGTTSLDAVRNALDREFRITKVERKPVRGDIEDIEGDPYHWVAGFPEALDMNGDGGFDVILGNPPYGSEVLGDAEDVLLAGYEVGDANDVVAPFVERAFQLLRDGGYFGNVVTLRVVYQNSMSRVRDLARRQLQDCRVACFTRRPTQVFEGCQVRTGIVTGQRTEDETDMDISTSEFIRFFDDEEHREREDVFRNISFKSTDGLLLGDRIGNGDNAMPKIGFDEIQGILETLKDRSDTVLEDVMERNVSPGDETDHVVWKRRGISYYMNPLLEDLYPPGERPDETLPVYFESELKRKAAFLALQSSLFYVYWMAYGDERHLNWTEFEAFPFPDDEELEEHREEIIELADVLWGEMAGRFIGGTREVIERAAVLKPIMDEADDLLGPLYGLDEGEIEYVKRYQEPYRLSRLDDPDQEQMRLDDTSETSN